MFILTPTPAWVGHRESLVGLIGYFVQSNDIANCVDPDLRFKFVDDLLVLEFVMPACLLSDYNFKNHVASDIDEHYVDAIDLKTQKT